MSNRISAKLNNVERNKSVLYMAFEWCEINVWLPFKIDAKQLENFVWIFNDTKTRQTDYIYLLSKFCLYIIAICSHWHAWQSVQSMAHWKCAPFSKMLCCALCVYFSTFFFSFVVVRWCNAISGKLILFFSPIFRYFFWANRTICYMLILHQKFRVNQIQAKNKMHSFPRKKVCISCQIDVFFFLHHSCARSILSCNSRIELCFNQPNV